MNEDDLLLAARRAVLTVANATTGEDPDFDELATGSLIAAFNRMAPADRQLVPTTRVIPPAVTEPGDDQ